MRRTRSPCCARAAAGHAAAAPPRNVMNSRRLIASPEAKDKASYWLKPGFCRGQAPCSLWVKSGHVQCKKACPLFPRKRTCATPKTDVCFVPRADMLFNHIIGTKKHRTWNGKPKG